MDFHQHESATEEVSAKDKTAITVVVVFVFVFVTSRLMAVVLIQRCCKRNHQQPAAAAAAAAAAAPLEVAVAVASPQAQYDHSRLAFDANLSSFLLLSERMLILETILHQQQDQQKRVKNHRSSFDDRSHQDDDAVGLEVIASADNDVTDLRAQNDAPSSQVAEYLLTVVSTFTGWHSAKQQEHEQKEYAQGDTEEARGRGPTVNSECCICFEAFDEEEDETRLGPEEEADSGGVENQQETKKEKTLVSGTACHHRFHYSCLMLWLQEHNSCPYCQADMVSVDEFRQAAVETLGANRVMELET